MLRDRGAILTGLGIGAGLMFFLDPAHGRRRRAQARDKIARASRLTRDAAGATCRDLTNRTSGVAARLRGSDRPVSDDVLVERVRAQLGRYVSNPRAIEVHAGNGVITLRGPIPENEIDRLVKAIERVSGVRDVVNQFTGSPVHRFTG